MTGGNHKIGIVMYEQSHRNNPLDERPNYSILQLLHKKRYTFNSQTKMLKAYTKLTSQRSSYMEKNNLKSVSLAEL